MGFDRDFGSGADDLGEEGLQVGLGDVVVGESHRDRIAGAERRPGQPGVQSESAGGAGEQVGAADVGDEADADLGHGDLGGLGDHPDVAVPGDSDAAAHHDAVHDRHIRFGVGADAGVEPVLVEEERPRFGAAGFGRVIQRDHVPAGTQAAVAGPAHHHR